MSEYNMYIKEVEIDTNEVIPVGHYCIHTYSSETPAKTPAKTQQFKIICGTSLPTGLVTIECFDSNSNVSIVSTALASGVYTVSSSDNSATPDLIKCRTEKTTEKNIVHYTLEFDNSTSINIRAHLNDDAVIEKDDDTDSQEEMVRMSTTDSFSYNVRSGSEDPSVAASNAPDGSIYIKYED